MSLAQANPSRPYPQMRVRAAANDDSMKRVSIAAVVLYLLLVPQQFNFDVAGILMSP